MRTATPLATWRSTTDRGRSATSSAISTPRFIGPGCMTRADPDQQAGAPGGEPVVGRCTRATTAGTNRPPASSGAAGGRQTSTCGSTASRSWDTAATGQPSSDGGSRLPGATRVISAPRAARARTPSGPPGCGPRRPRWPPAGRRNPARPPRPRAGRPARPHLADRVAVEESLRGVLVPPVTGVDDAWHRPTGPPGPEPRPTDAG